MVEAAGIEPASESASLPISTCIVRPLGFPARGRVGLTPLGRRLALIAQGSSEHVQDCSG
jgi:hypothetical protein